MQSVVMSMCLSVRSNVSKITSKLREIFCTCYLWLWLGPPLTTMQCVMYFSFVADVMFAHNGPYDAWLIGCMLRGQSHDVYSSTVGFVCLL